MESQYLNKAGICLIKCTAEYMMDGSYIFGVTMAWQQNNNGERHGYYHITPNADSVTNANGRYNSYHIEYLDKIFNRYANPESYKEWRLVAFPVAFVLTHSQLSSFYFPSTHLQITRTHDDVIKWKHFRRYWPFVRGIHRSPVNSPHKAQWPGALIFSLICAWTHGWVNNQYTGDLIRHRAHYDVTVMFRRGV